MNSFRAVTQGKFSVLPDILLPRSRAPAGQEHGIRSAILYRRFLSLQMTKKSM
jgi:hypothetical protein